MRTRRFLHLCISLISMLVTAVLFWLAVPYAPTALLLYVPAVVMAGTVFTLVLLIVGVLVLFPFTLWKPKSKKLLPKR